MFETTRKPIKKELTCESIKLSNIKIIVKKSNSESFITEELQNSLKLRGPHLAQLLYELL